MTFLKKPARGLVCGAFNPPHAGHVYLCDFARAYVESLIIVLCCRPDDPIPGALRASWMRELYPGARIIRLESAAREPLGETARAGSDDLVAGILREHPQPIDVVFGSPAEGRLLAQRLGARFAPVEASRSAVPVRSAQVRADPYRNWRHLPPPVRPYFLKRVTLFGAESTGKTTLARALARRFDTVIAPEFGRFHTEVFGAGATSMEDMRQIVMGHLAGVAAASRQANRVLIEDTDPVLTAVWSDTLAGGRDPWFANYRAYPDLYLFCDIDVPWVADGARYFADPEDRRAFHLACERELLARGARFVRISGSRKARLAKAVSAVESLLQPAPPKT